MSSQRKERAEKRAEHADPINYTCGDCGYVHEFDPENPYVCEKKIEKEETV